MLEIIITLSGEPI